MRALVSAILVAFAVMPMAVHAEDSAIKQIAARVELHAIPSLTLSDQQFLAGDANGKAVTVTGEFRIAQGSGKLPVVILIHGSGGIGPNVESWARDLNAMGISTFALDGFTGRGLTSVNMDQAALGRLMQPFTEVAAANPYSWFPTAGRVIDFTRPQLGS